MAASKQVQVDRIEAVRMTVPIVGTAPLIMHRFSEKAKRQMLDAMQGNKTAKQPKNPEEEYDAAFYRMKNSTRAYGFPAIAFKAATVAGARFYAGVTMTAIKQFVYFYGDAGRDGTVLNRITGTPHMREDVVRVGNGGTDLRYRPEFPEWTTTLEVLYVESVLSQSSVLSLIEAGGMGCGVGEWRPEKGGAHGTYRLDPTRKVEVRPAARKS